jgi:Ca2+-binding EF-hand superfamily protein
MGALASVLKNPDDEEKMMKLFKSYDKDDSGKVSFRLSFLFPSPLPETPQLDRTELKAFAKDLASHYPKLTPERANQLVDLHCDANHDGKVTFGEFKRFIQTTAENENKLGLK